ncbi:MAG: hypothetical protein KJO43_03490 [Phycisphaerae bacterium]|nr:hypothetical protein [Phycisphaerae bacterium]
MPVRSLIICAVVLVGGSAGCERAAAPVPTGVAADPVAAANTDRVIAADPVQAEVIANIRAQSIGQVTVAALDLPDAYLERVADRIIRSSYQDHFYRVEGEDVPPPAWSPPRVPGSFPWAVLPSPLPEPVVDARRALRAAFPERRGFRATPMGVWRPALETGDDDEVGVARLIAARLASDGLIATTAATLRLMPTLDLATLDRLGLPVDLLRHFRFGTEPASAEAVLAEIRRRQDAGVTDAAITRAARFDFAPSAPGFRALPESGQHAIAGLRLQLTRGAYWSGEGAGGSIDVTRQLVAALPDTDFTLSVQDLHRAELLATIRATFTPAPGSVLRVIVEPLPVSQWAQDNGKAGRLASEGDAPAMLVPRYASRRDDASLFVPGESSLLDGLGAAGMTLVPSSLLFQGGDILVVRHPGGGERVALVGDAEIHRNVALGLRPGQVEVAFARELGVDRCVVVPSVSFHVDFDVTVRAGADGLVAFVNDTAGAVDIVLKLGARAIAAAGLLEPAEVDVAIAALEAGEGLDYLQRVGTPVLRSFSGQAYPAELAACFARDPQDVAAANLQRYLLALDLLTARTVADEQMPPDHPARGYLRVLRRAATHEATLRRALQDAGLRVVPVPSLSDAGRSLTTINALHDSTRLIMPATGGFFTPLDEAAMNTYRRHLGPDVQIIPIHCSESQRRAGGIHCSVAVTR